MKYPGLIQVGTTNTAALRAIKAKLSAEGFALDVNNTSFGPTTEKAVVAFQKKMLLMPDGVVGPLTWERLFDGRSLAQPTATSMALRSAEIALTYLYVREKTGKNDGVEVEAFLKSVGLGAGYAWCAAFVYYVVNEASVEMGAENPLKKTGGVLAQWNATPKEKRVTKPQAGDIGIMDFGKGTGHMFIVTKVVGDKVYTVEGNTSGQPSSAALDRDGQGVYERCRSISSAKGFIRI